MRHLLPLSLFVLGLSARPVRAEELPPERRFTLNLHVLVGAEPHGDGQGTPVAFGAGAEVLWRGQVGLFAALLASEGTAVEVGQVSGQVNGQATPALGDRISVPLGAVVRPLAFWTARPGGQSRWWRQLLANLGAQVGVTVEHVRTSDDSATVAGLHLGAVLDVPLYSGAGGGVALRLLGRGIFAPTITLEPNRSVHEPGISAQIYAGICYYP